MTETIPCRWREERPHEGYWCLSAKFIAPPNRVTLGFCQTCCYREAPAEPSVSVAQYVDEILPCRLESARSWVDLPPIFCITCRQTPERTALAARHFRECGLDVQFFPGIHGQTFGLRTVHEAKPSYRMPSGHVGLVLSHYMLWQTLVFLPHEEVLILEDDAEFPPDFRSRFSQAFGELPDDWQFVHVGSVGTELKPRRHLSPNVCMVDMPFGTHAYLIKRSVLPFLLATNHQARTHIDIQIAQNSLPGMRSYVFFPSLVSQHSAAGSWRTLTSISDPD
jgi:GR25 family glycosyltransferase involved in LPS biosynthesis